jgi:hypothetical protein
MTFTSKYEIGQVVQFDSLGKTRTGTITGMLFTQATEPLYEIDEGELLDPEKITATLVKQEVADV